MQVGSIGAKLIYPRRVWLWQKRKPAPTFRPHKDTSRVLQLMRLSTDHDCVRSRLLQLWISRPLCSLDALRTRQQTVCMFVRHSVARKLFWESCTQFDLERALGMAERWALEAPANICYRSTIEDTTRQLNRIKAAVSLCIYNNTECSSQVRCASSMAAGLKSTLAMLPTSENPSSLLHHDHHAASVCDAALSAMSPLLIDQDPLASDNAVLEATMAVRDAQSALESHLEEVKSQLRCPELKYTKHVGSPYVFEISMTALKKGYGNALLPPELMIVSSTKNLMRFRSESVAIDLYPRYEAACKCLEDATRSAAQHWLLAFVGFRSAWRWLSDTAARWDVLCSLAHASSQPGVIKQHCSTD